MVWEEKVPAHEPGREMATQNLGIGCGLEKWTSPGKWILNASQIGRYMV